MLSRSRNVVILDRIKIDPTHFMRWIDIVNPVYINKIEQIHSHVGSPKAIPKIPDMLFVYPVRGMTPSPKAFIISML